LTSSYPISACITFPAKLAAAQACREIARVLKPGGTAIISDFITTGFYQKVTG